MIGKKVFYGVFLSLCFFETYAITLSLNLSDLEGNRIAEVKQGEPFFIEVIVFDDQQNLGEPVLMHMQKLSSCQRYPVSTHITVINGGKQQVQRKYVYKARIDAVGPFALGPAYFDLGSQVIRSPAVSFLVVKGTGAQKQQVSDPFIQVKTHKESVYVDQQVLLTVRLCYKKPVDSFVLEPFSLTNGFVMQLGQPVAESVSYDGHSWSCFTYTFAVYPRQKGDLVIPGLRAHGERVKESSSGSFMAHFFFGFDREKIEARSQPLVIAVKSLPNNAQHARAVGEFTSFTASLDKNTLEPGTAATLILTLAGNGNMQQITFDNWQLPSELKRYDSKFYLEIDKQRPGFFVRRQEFIIQALAPGTFTIAPYLFTFFNPVTASMEQLKTRPLVLTVKKGVQQKEFSQEKNLLVVHKKWSWPIIPYWIMVTLSLSLLLFLLGNFIWYRYEVVIEKKIAYYVFKRAIHHAKIKNNAKLLYNAWFVLLARRLGIKKIPQSLRDIEQLFDQQHRVKWRYYISELERIAFEQSEIINDIDDLISQTYDLLSKLEEVL